MELLSRVKLIMNITDTSRDAVISELLNNITGAVLLYCGAEELPTALEFVVVEATVSRMNRLGSEGLKSENIDVIGLNYIEDTLSPYVPYLDSVKKSMKKVRFL